MGLETGDVIAYLSALSGSVGGAISATALTTSQMNNLWPDFTDLERTSGTTRYRKMFWKNTSGSDEMVEPVLYAPDLPEGGLVLSLALGFDDLHDDDPNCGNMVALSAPAVIGLIADGTDSRVVTVWGVDDDDLPVAETITLTSDTEVLTTTTFSKVWAVCAASESTTTNVDVRQGPSGNTVGTISQDRLCCFLWVSEPDSKASGITLPDLQAGGNYGMWERIVVPADADPLRPNSLIVAIEEA